MSERLSACMLCQAKDEKYTQIVWEVRKHILEHKDELDQLTRKKVDAERQLDLVFNEMDAFRAGMHAKRAL